MIPKDVIDYIEKKIPLDDGKKEPLIRFFLRNWDRPLSLFDFMKSLNEFQSGEVRSLPIPQKKEMIQSLIQGVEKSKGNKVFAEIIQLLFPENEIDEASSPPVPLSLTRIVFKQLREERNNRVRAFWVELLLHLYRNPLPGSRMEDYLHGLHHPDELFRCKTLYFLYENYNGKILLGVLKEIPGIKPPPTLLFCKTLRHYLSLHPELNWIQELKSLVDDQEVLQQNWDPHDPRWILFEESRESLKRHQFLSIQIQGEQPFLGGSEKPFEDHNLKSYRSAPGIRFERLEKIRAYFEKEEKLHVPLYDNQNQIV